MSARAGKSSSAAGTTSRTNVFLGFMLTFFLCQSLLLPKLAQADTAGPSNPTSTAGSGANWTNAVNALTSNTVYATFTGTTQQYLLLTNYGFAIPAGSTINGVQVSVKGMSSGGNPAARTIQVALTTDGSTVAGTAKTQQLAATDAAYTLGTTADVWGATLTQALVNGTSFGVMIRDNDTTSNGTFSIDVATITVTYTLPNNAPSLSISQPDGTGDTVTVGQAYNLTYSLSDAEEVVTSAFYYDTDNTGLNGTAIAGACATAAEGSNVTCSWDTTGVTPGTYYVYGIADDGVNPASSAYSTGMITINAPASSAALLHNSVNTASTKHAVDGGWGVTSAKYGQFTCDTCHIKGTTNIKRVKTSITTPDTSKGTLPGNGQAIVFSRISGNAGNAGVMGDDSTTPRATSNKICEICHTYDAAGTNGVNVHPYNSAGATINSPSHQNNSKDCTQCHKHSEGFKKAACDSCHGNPPVNAGQTGEQSLCYRIGNSRRA